MGHNKNKWNDTKGSDIGVIPFLICDKTYVLRMFDTYLRIC